MQVTIFGIIWLTALIIFFFNNHAKYMVSITLLSMVMQQASVLYLDSVGVGPQIPTSVAMVAWNVRMSPFWNNFCLKIKRGNLLEKMCIAATISFIIVIMVSRYKNINKYTIDDLEFKLLFIQLLSYILCFYCMWNIKIQLKAEELEKIFVGVIAFVVVVGILQMMAQMNLLPIKKLLEVMIYTDTDALNMVWEYPRVFSTFLEPSYCSPFLVGGFYYIISLNKKNKSYIALSLILVVLIMGTFSSTAYGTMFIVGLVYLILSKNKKALKYLVPAAIALLIILLVSGQLLPILNSVIFQKNKTGSAWLRGHLDDLCYEAFTQSMMWGNGYKNIRGSQFLKSLAAQLGIMGCITWIMMWLPVCIYGFRHRKNRKIVGITLYLISVLCSMFIAIPDVDITVFWGMMYLVAATLGIEIVSEKKEKI